MKPVWKSRTILLMCLILSLNSFPEVRAAVPESWMTAATAVAAIVLRLLTNEPVGIPEPPKIEE